MYGGYGYGGGAVPDDVETLPVPVPLKDVELVAVTGDTGEVPELIGGE